MYFRTYPNKKTVLEFLRAVSQNKGFYSFQCDKELTLSQKQFLMEAILNKANLPKLYAVLEIGMSYTVVSSSEAGILKAIIEFYENGFPLGDDFIVWNKESDTMKDLSGMYYSDIEKNDPCSAGRFLSFGLDFIIIDTDAGLTGFEDTEITECSFWKIAEKIHGCAG